MQSFVEGTKVLQGTQLKPIIKDREHIIGYYMVTEDSDVYKVYSGSMFQEDLIAMFPSDLQWTMLEDIWVNGYDSTLEENQARYMNDFWEWCEVNCTSKEVHEHTIFKFAKFVN
jgi:hypothetical protein